MADNQLGPLQPKQTTASDIRKVVANGTKTTGKGFTIANKDELEQKEVSKKSGLPKAVKIGGGVGANVGGTVGLNNNKTVVQPTVKAPKKEAPQGPVVQPTITKEQLTSDLFKNPIVQPINNVKIANINGESVNQTKLSNGVYDYNRNKLIIKTDAERKNDVYNGIKALYTDAYNKVTDGQQLTIQDVLSNEKYKKQFDGLDTTRLQELVNDANELAQYDDYDTQNILSVLDKHSDLGLTMNYNDLSPESKAAYLAEMSSGNVDSGLWKLVEMPGNLLSPLWWAEHAIEWGGKLFGKDIDIKTGNEQLRETVKGLKHDMLNEAETDAAARDEIAELDKKYAKYFTKNKDGEKKWNSVMKQADYEKDLAIIRDKVQSEHGDNNLLNLGRNTVLNLIEVASVVHDMIREPGTLISGLASTAVGGAENVAGYGWDVYDWLVNSNAKIEHKDITQHLADLGGYETFEDAIQSAEYNMKDSMFKDLGIAILKQIQIDSSTAGLMGNYIAESYGDTDKFLQSLGERPAETLSDIVTMLEGGAFLAGKMGIISPMKAELLVESLGSLDPFEVGMKYGNKLNYGPVLKGETAALKLGGRTLKLPLKGVKNAGELIVNKLTGISEEERKFIIENPDDVDKFIKGKENSQSLIDKIKEKFDELTSDKKKEGEEYEKIKNSNTIINTKDLIAGVKESLKKIGATLTKTGIKLSKRFSPAIESKVNELYTYINDLQKKGKAATAEDVHWLRQQLDSLAQWEKTPQGMDAIFVNTVKEIRNLVSNTLKDQVPGMKEIDSRYSALVNEIKALKQDWFDKFGNLKDSAYSKIRNLTNKGSNQPKLERLEKLIPGITQDLKALAVAETVEKATKQNVGQYAQQIWGVGGGITAIAGLLTGGASIVPSVLGLLGLTLATPKNLVSLLKFGGKIDKKINSILDKVTKGIKLTATETAELARYLNENRENLREKVEYMKEKGLLSDEEYKAAIKKIDDAEYARAQQKARTKAGDKEVQLTPEDEKRVKEWINNNAKNPGFVIKMLDEVQMEAKTGDKTTQGFFYDKYINLLENPTDTTAQHEFFHGVFSLVDDKTKAYLIQEARKILKESGMDKVSAEEWLAESFGIYAKRKMIDMGVIKAPRSFEQKLRNFFQKVYEWIQNFNGDRKTINKVFEEIYGGNKTLKDGKLDLSDLLGNKKVDKNVLNEVKLGSNGLRKKSVYHGSPADFDKFDSSHMGEGEGAQAHGWGHYVAVNEKTGRHYADMGGEPSMRFRGERIKAVPRTPAEHAISDVELYIDGFEYDFKDAIETKTNDALRNIEYQKERLGSKNETPEGKAVAKERIQFYNEYIKALKDMKERDFELVGNRNLYSLDIPDPVKADTPTGSNYLEEGDIITEKAALGFVKKLNELDKNLGKDLEESILFEDNGKYNVLGYVNGEKVYNRLEDLLGSDKKASKFLESIGYDGIHYNGGRDGEAYVIFNDDALQIKDHLRYKKKIGDKEVEINKDITSPEQMAKVNSKGLSVIHDFISEKQAEKALDVSKDILDENGNPYLWTHTNKYDDTQIANFENVRDSRYKEFGDKQVAWFSNNEAMSRSYADSLSTLANTKSPKTLDEFKKYIEEKFPERKKSVSHGDGMEWSVYEKPRYNIEKTKDGYELSRQTETRYEYDGVKDFYNRWAENKSKDLSGLSKEQLFEEAKKGLMSHVNSNYAGLVDIKLNKDGSVVVTDKGVKNVRGEYPTEKDLLAKGFSKIQDTNRYHYQGIIQNVKKPLVVDYRNPEGTKNYWNKLGSVYDFLEKTDKSQLNKLEKALDDAFGRREEVNIERRKVWDKIEEESHRLRKEYQKAVNTYDFDKPGDAGAKRELQRADFLKDSFNKYQNIVYEGFYRELTKEELAQLKDLDALNQWGEFIDLVNDYRNKYKDYDIFGRNGIGLEKFLENEGFSKDIISLTHDLPTYDHTLGENIKNGKYALTEKQMQTNDYVFYALNNGGYDGVLFKNISDYGGDSIGEKRPGDVLATFQSKDFKSWDNSNPTDSKYISYKKKVSLDKKSEGLQKKNSSGLLAKGRDRMGDNGMRYKKEVPEDKKLVGLHNLGIDKLRGVIELGGMPMPSIAVTKKGVPHESYGDITFIMKESAINPALSRKNKLYTVDGYTPTVPQPTIRVKDTKEANLLMDKIQKGTGIGYGELMQWLEYHDDRYFKDYPKLKEFDKYYDQLTEKKLFDGFTYTGKRRYKDYNLDNIVKSMVGNKRDAFNGAFWKMVAQSQGNTTVEKLRDRKYGLKDKDLAEKIGEKYYDALKELASKKGIEQKIESLSDYGRFAENVSDAYRANTDAWWRELTQWDGAEKTIYSKITKEDLEPLQKIIKEAAELPRPYSEAKPERAIRFDEVGAVVAPEGKLKEVKDMLKDTGLKVYGYKEGERMSVVDKVADDNGLRFKKGYHGSPYSFDKFDEKRIGKGEGSQVHGYGLYIAGTKDTAKKYAEMGRRDSFFKGQPISKFLKSKEGKVYTKAERDAIKQVGEYIPDYSPEEAIDQLKEDLYPARTPYEKEVIRALDRLDWKDFESGRNLYDVDIPDEVKRDTPSGTNYLDEEKLYGKKVYEKIFEEAKKSPEWKNTKGVDGYIADRLKFKGEDKMYGVWIRQALEYGFQNDKEASKFLQSLGYDGIEYTGLEDGKSYVLFKGSDIDITNHIRYKKGLTAKDQTQTPEFKKWFEGSKVVDKSGKPLVMYHGTNSDFNTFDKGLIKSQNWGKGFYFTSNKEDAKQYGKNTKAVYLDVKNPLDLTSGENEAEYNKWYGKKNSPYDGYVVNFSNGDKMVVVKSPNQIKSATDNIGTFDKNNPDIRYKKGLEKKRNLLDKKSNASILAKGRDRK